MAYTLDQYFNEALTRSFASLRCENVVVDCPRCGKPRTVSARTVESLDIGVCHRCSTLLERAEKRKERLEYREKLRDDIRARKEEVREKRRERSANKRKKPRGKGTLSKVELLGPSKPIFGGRKCHDCGNPTYNYRCDKCRAKWAKRHSLDSGYSPAEGDFSGGGSQYIENHQRG